MESKLKTIISSDHERKKVFRCELCGIIFNNETNLTQHIGGVHEGNYHSDVTFVTTAVIKRGTLNHMLPLFMKD